jgi:hypothetical protein
MIESDLWASMEAGGKMSVVQRARIKWQSLNSRLTGLSFPVVGGGVSWKPQVDEKAIVRSVITALEDKRALYEHYDREIQSEVNPSLMNIRALLTDAIGKLNENSPAASPFKVMRAACRDFLTQSHSDLLGRPIRRLHIPGPGVEGSATSESIETTADNFFVALGKIRGVFGQQLAHLAYLYQIDLEEQLAAILPPEPRSDDGTA